MLNANVVVIVAVLATVEIPSKDKGLPTFIVKIGTRPRPQSAIKQLAQQKERELLRPIVRQKKFEVPPVASLAQYWSSLTLFFKLKLGLQLV